MASNADVVDLYWDTCWNGRQADRLAEVFHDPYTHGRAEFSPTLMAGIMEEAWRQFPDFRVQVNETQILDATVITRSTFIGTHGGDIFGLSPTGKTVEMPTLDIFFFREGKVWLYWHLTDHLPIIGDRGRGPHRRPDRELGLTLAHDGRHQLVAGAQAIWTTGDNAAMQPRETDEESIRRVAMAYLESWLDGDGERMRGALHPDLAKRGLDYAADRRPSGVHHLTAEYMERSAAKGPRPQFARTCAITVLDVADSIASAKVVSEPFIDYLHLAKLDGRWSIVNVLYEDREPASE